MPAIQSSYPTQMAVGYNGEVIDLGLYDAISREVEPATIGFGVPVVQGTGDRQCKVAGAGSFLGITIRDTTLDPRRADVYAQGDTCAIMTKGTMLVVAGEAVVAGDLVYRTAAGVLNKTSASNTLIANARWATSAASGALAKITLA